MKKYLYGFFLCTFVFFYSCSSNPVRYQLPDQPPSPKALKNISVALVLSGGGSRGLAHVGVLEVLEKNHIPIDLIVGSSAGGFIGAMYADDPYASKLKDKIIHLKKWDLLDVSMISSLQMLWEINGPVKGHSFRNFLNKSIKSKYFEELHIPLVVVTTDANTGETFSLRSGQLIPALEATAALPLVFKPMKIYGRTLIDGGVSSPLPIEVAKEFNPQLIIAVDIGTSPDYGPVATTYQLGYRALHISYYHLIKWQSKQADVLIHPKIDQYNMFEDKYNIQMIEAGQRAAEEMLPTIKKKIDELKMKSDKW